MPDTSARAPRHGRSGSVRFRLLAIALLPTLVILPLLLSITMARWNAKFNADKAGFVTKFEVDKAFLDNYERKIVGGSEHEEYWIPAEDLSKFNANIVGQIEVIAEFRGE